MSRLKAIVSHLFIKVSAQRLCSLFLCICFSPVFAEHSWTRTNPGGGGTIAMTGATANGTLLVASDLSGVYRSFDDGDHWTALGANNGLVASHTSALGFHATDGNTFFVGTGDGLYKTTDRGENFNRVLPDANNPFTVEYIESITVAKSNPNTVYVTQHEWDTTQPSNIYKSTDGGIHWQVVPGTGLPAYLHMVKLLVHPANANIVYALTGKSRWGCSPARLYQSMDGGANWARLGTRLDDILDMDIHPTDTNIVYVSTFEANTCPTTLTEDFEYIGGDENSGAFYKSTNGGTSFTQLSDKTGIISAGIRNPDTIRLVDVLYPYDWNENAGTWESINAGVTWTHTGLVSNWFTGYTDNQYYAYTPSFNGLSKTLTKDIFNADRMYGVFGAGPSKTTDGGRHLNVMSTKNISTDHWLSTGIENINGHALDINEANPDVIYMGGYDIGFWHSTDHGGSWSRTQPSYNLYSEYVWNIGDAPVDPQLAVRGEGANVSTILNDPAREGVVWASFSKDQFSDESQGVIAKTGLFKSTAHGEGFELISNGLPTGDDSIRMYGLSLNVNSPVNNRTLYMTVKGDVYKSSNDGQSWSAVSVPDLAKGGLKFTEVDKFDGNLVYAGGENGLWRSNDAGVHWMEVGIPEMRGSRSPMRKDIVPTDPEIDWSKSEAVTTLYAWEGVFDIQTDPNVPNRLYVTAYGEGKGLYRSDNAGATWTKLITDKSMRGVAIAPQNSNLIYATSSQSYHSGGTGNSLGILYSTDAGSTWQQANNGMAWNYGGMIEVETGINPNVWVWSPGTGIQYSPAELPLVVACDTAATTFNLPSAQWRQISLPCAPPNNAKTVQAVFGDDLNGNYNEDWVVYSYKPGSGYQNVGLNGALAQGVGYWLIHYNGSVATLDLPVGSTQTVTIPSEQCASSNGCYRISLPTKTGSTQWNMSGYPLVSNVALDRFRVVTNSGPCASGCTLDKAKSEGIVENRLWSYNGASYDVMQGSDSVQSWRGFWTEVLAGGDGLEPRLEVPLD